MDYWLQSSRVVLPDGVRPAALHIAGGQITELLPEAPPGANVTRAGSHVISPGLVDCHVHINEPGRSEWEGFDTATRAAAAGGVTTLVDMPLNCLPVTTTRAALDQKIEACSGQCFVDVGFWGGVIPGNARELPELALGGVLGCKAFLVHSGIDEFPNATEADLRQAMPVLRDLGLPLLAHAELDLGASVSEPDPRVYRSFLESRPPSWEEAAIALLIRLCRETRCPVHIVHLSAASCLPLLRAAKDEGLPISAETCPHYLCLEAEQIPAGATEFKCAPPIREHENREALWQGLLEGVIDFVITDHSPCTPGLKQRGQGNFHQAWGGIASLQLGLSTLWTEARQRGASLTQMARWLSSAPARFAGLGRHKGELRAGRAADLVIWDPEQRFRVRSDELFFRHKLSPYLEREVYGRVQQTLLAGRVVYDGPVSGGVSGAVSGGVSGGAHPAGPIGRLILQRTNTV
jgi:allantoinase